MPYEPLGTLLTNLFHRTVHTIYLPNVLLLFCAALNGRKYVSYLSFLKGGA